MLIALKRLLSSCLPINQVWSEERKASGVLQRMSLGPGKNTENPTMMQFFTWDSRHPNMTWWQHLAAESSQLAEYGITQIWLPPAHKGLSENSVGYDAYDLWDLGEFNQKGTVSTRWGSKDQLVEAIRIARENGIDVLLDAVLNHKLGGDRTETFKAVPVDGNNRMKEIGPAREIEGWTAFDFPGRFGKYSALRWTQEHFTGVDWDHRTRTNAVYRIIGEGHKGWSPNADKELGNYDYLLGVDIDHRHPAVREDLFNWAQWSLETTGATGFRLDAIKHYDRTFLLEWVRKIRASNSERSRSFMVAEYWSVNIKLMLEYLRAMKGEVAFFDKHLHDNFHNVCKQGPVFDLRTIFKGTLINTNPHDAVTFVDNHDTQPGQSLESWVNDKFKLQAYALILLRGQGHPCVFYGDVYPNNDCYEPAISDAVIRLMKTRKSHAFGKLTEFFEHKNCIGFARAGDAKHPGCVVVLSNSSPDASTAQNTISAKLGSGFVNTRFIGLFEPHGQVDVPANGIGRFTCPPGSLQVWIPEPSQAS